MARGRKKALPLNEQIEQLTSEIEEMEAALKELKKTRKELEDKIDIEKLSNLDSLITAKGLTYDEVIELLSKNI